ncbi:hypothetical protein QO014_002195 [Kaistia dalseonensis]|uniref:Uncharacterized protein n=1 Tax=Kaistia dalseonensis TaxID=410840 RepID=A0ABU0H7C4_9HYPH|nr:hypothetical protein [Kaistia dalseonensis]
MFRLLFGRLGGTNYIWSPAVDFSAARIAATLATFSAR